MQNNKKHYVFVYGTLKKGYHANYIMGGQPLGKATIEYFNLYNLGGFPCVIPVSDSVNGIVPSVEGEIYHVTDKDLKSLDVYEGVSSGLFKRIKTPNFNPFGLSDADVLNMTKEVMVYVWGRNTLPEGAIDITGVQAKWKPNAT